MQWLTDNLGEIISLVAGLHVVALIIVNLTPTPKDNEVLAKVYGFVKKLAGLITAKSTE